MNLDRMIVKVQLPLYDSYGQYNQALAYNEDRSIEAHMPVDKDVIKAVGKKHKAFFYAKVEGGILVLLEKAPWQEW